MSYESLSWNGKLSYPGMVVIPTISDGSCFFHAILSAFFIPYKAQQYDGNPVDRKKFVLDLRKDLANKLGDSIDPNDPDSPTHYDILSRSELREMSKEMPEYSLSSLQLKLKTSSSVGNEFNEFISNVLEKDIYILDSVKQDVYVTGNDFDILYKNRPSIVILFSPGHYELVGINESGKISTLFDFNHPFIATIRKRLEDILGRTN